MALLRSAHVSPLHWAVGWYTSTAPQGQNIMSTTLSMWLGIAFLALAIIAVLLQAWLWGPKFWNEEANKTEAPRSWLRVHAATGYGYTLIYFFMMWHMVPRLWEYQYELPARTVIHAVVAITIGVLLITKISIVLFFRHFEEAMPRFGFGILLCTVMLTFLSVPYAARAHDFSGEALEPQNIERVKRLLAGVTFDEPDVNVDALVTEAGLDRGRSVLSHQCTVCHDMRTILIKPRTAQRWNDVNVRMLDKPSVFGERLKPEDIPFVTAYLVAITPEIQRSSKRMQASDTRQQQREDASAQLVHEGDDATAPALDDAAGRALFMAKCTECHEVDETEGYGGADLSEWRSVIASMVEEGAEVNSTEAVQLAAYLAKTWPSKGDDAPAAGDAQDLPKLEVEPTKVLPDVKPEPKPEPEPKPVTKKKRPVVTPPKAEPEPKPEPKPTPKPAPPSADLSAGKSVFTKKCKSCHGADGKGQSSYGIKIGSPDLTTSSLSLSSITKVISAGRSGTKMKGYASKLSADELRDVAAYVKRF